MNRFLVLACCALLPVISGCVTESSNALPAAEPEKAAQAYLDLGVGYFRQGDLPQAQSALEKAIEQDPGLATAHTVLALVYERMGDIDAAEKQYRRAASLSHEDPDTLNAYAAFLCRTPGRRAEAMRVFDKAIAIPLSVKYTDKAALLTNAGVCIKEDDLARAEDYLRRALQSNARYAEALLQMADVAYLRGNHLQARAFLERYLAVAPVSPPALWLGVRIEQALGDPEAARVYAVQLKSEFPESVETRLLLEQERDARQSG